jgi:single-strand DNA-binding protein
MTVNKVILVGNLGADPEVRQTNSGMQVANLRIATSERAKGQDGEWSDHTEWHRVVCFGKTAENVARFLKKGRQVYVEGKLRTTKFQKDGVDKWSTEIIAFNVSFLAGGREDAPAGGGSSAQGNSSAQGYGQGGKPNDDIPF